MERVGDGRMTTAEFIDALEDQRVVDADLARQLRAKAIDGGHRVTPEAILKYLVKTDVVTKWRSEELSAMLRNEPPPAPRREADVLNLVPIEEEDEYTDMRSDAPQGPREPTGPPRPPAPPRTVDRDPLFTSKAARSASPFDDAVADDGLGSRISGGAYKLGGHKKKNQKRTAGGKNQWDSPLLLVGGGGLALLLVAGVLLYYLMFRENAAAVLADANKLFEAGAYNQAIGRYQEFVKAYPSHQDASRAKVQLEMTKLWQSVEGNSDPADSLALAQQVIGEVEDQPAFISGGEGEEGVSQGKQDLGLLLVRIGKALVEKAEKATDDATIQDTIKHIGTVLQLSANEKYVPEKYRNAPALAEIQDALDVIKSRQQRDARLAATLAAMDAATSGGDTAAAYAARLNLLTDFPALADEPTLADKVREASAAEKSRVKFETGGPAPETRWPERAVVAELALAERRTPSAAAASGAPIVVRIDGALYGLRSGDGALLWRRFAGNGATSAPLLLDDGGVVAADLSGGELWRLDAATGKLAWRLPLGDKLTGVIAAGPRLLAASESGKLYVVDAARGAPVGHVQLTQPLRAAPAINERGDKIYVTAEHSIIYTLSAEDYSCLGVYYLGHSAGAIVAPPVAVLNKVLVADNSGADTCRVRVLSLDEHGVIASDAAEQRLAGLVITPMAAAARRIAVATTRGQVGVFDIGAAEDQSALTIVARRDGQDVEPLARFVLLHEGKLWLAAKQLTKLAILPTENQLAVESMESDYAGDAFDAPLQAVGQLVVHVRRPAGRAGAVVAAVDGGTNRSAWEIEIAVPAAGAPTVDAAHMRVAAATASGAVFLLDRDALVRGVQDETVRASPRLGAPPLTECLDLGEGQLVAASEHGTQLLLVRPNDAQQSVRTVDLPAPLSGPLVAWEQGVVCPTEAGQVFLIDIATGAHAGTPFQPKLMPDRKYRWLAPAVAGSGNASRLIVTDGAERLWLVRQVAEPAPHLEEEKSVDVGPSPLASPLAVVGSHVVAGTEDGQLAAFALPDLTPAEPLKIGGRVVWGPFAAGEGVLLATDGGELVLVGADLAISWKQKIEHGDLGGRPLVAGGGVLVLHTAGGLSAINLADGKETGYAAIGQPVAAGPVALGERVVCAASDGALVVVNRP